MAGPKHPRHHDEAFKRQIVQSCESGKPSREIRAGHDIARSTPRRWVQGIRDSGSTRAADNRTPGRNEPVEPGRRDRQLEMEVDVWIGNGVLDGFLEDESLFGEFLRTPVSKGGVESLVVEPPHIVVEVGA